MTTTYDPNEISAEDGQRNDMETSHDQEETETSVTKEENEQMSETLDVGESDQSTRNENNRIEENETSTITGEDDKTVTADASGYNDDDVHNEHNAVEEDNDDDIDGEEDNEIEYTTEENNELGHTKETENTDEIEHDHNDEEIISDDKKSPSKLQTSDVNTIIHEKANNSDDLIPSEDDEDTDLCADKKTVQSSGSNARDIKLNAENTADGQHAEKRRLGMSGPALMKKTLKVKIQDISIDSDKTEVTTVAENVNEGNKSVMRKLMCTKCPEMFFTTEGYQRHLFKDHKVRCFDKYPPQVIEKTVTRFSEETYETNYKIVKSKNPEKNEHAVDDGDKTYRETDMAQEKHGRKELNVHVNVQSMPNDESNDGTEISSDGKFSKKGKKRRRKGTKSQLTRRKKRTVNATVDKTLEQLKAAMYKAYSVNQDKPTVKCLGCDTYFFSKDGMRTHFKNAHTNLNYEEVAENNESKGDETLNNESQVENENDASDSIVQTTVPHLEETEQTELPDIVPPTQNITRGRKCTRNDNDAKFVNRKQSKGSPSAPKTRAQHNRYTVKDNDVGREMTVAEEINNSTSEVSDVSNAITSYETRSAKTSTDVKDTSAGKSSAKEKVFNTKPIPKNKRKYTVDMDDIIIKHRKKIDDENDAEEESKSKNSNIKSYATRSKVHDSKTPSNVGNKNKGIKEKNKDSKNKKYPDTYEDQPRTVTTSSEDVTVSKRHKTNKRGISENSDMNAASTSTNVSHKSPKKQ